MWSRKSEFSVHTHLTDTLGQGAGDRLFKGGWRKAETETNKETHERRKDGRFWRQPVINGSGEKLSRLPRGHHPLALSLRSGYSHGFLRAMHQIWAFLWRKVGTSISMCVFEERRATSNKILQSVKLLPSWCAKAESFTLLLSWKHSCIINANKNSNAGELRRKIIPNMAPSSVPLQKDAGESC